MKKILSIILVPLFIFGSSQQLYATQQEHSHEHSANIKETAINRLSLNHGERWKMDKHTRLMSVKMKKTFFDADHSTQVSLNAVGIKLETQLNEMIAGCTMNGEAHNQLHLFLTDYIPTVKNLAKAKNLDIARKSAIKIKGYLEAYNKYFK